jgi:hypothetical protein
MGVNMFQMARQPSSTRNVNGFSCSIGLGVNAACPTAKQRARPFDHVFTDAAALTVARAARTSR